MFGGIIAAVESIQKGFKEAELDRGICPQCKAKIPVQRAAIKVEIFGAEYLIWERRCLDCGADFSTVKGWRDIQNFGEHNVGKWTMD